jgi:hypothetical protein
MLASWLVCRIGTRCAIRPETSVQHRSGVVDLRMHVSVGRGHLPVSRHIAAAAEVSSVAGSVGHRGVADIPQVEPFGAIDPDFRSRQV